MNKLFKILILICMIIICISILFFHIPKATMEIKYIDIGECVHSLSTYNLDGDELKDPQMVTITCDVRNKSFLKSIYHIQPKFTNMYNVDILTSDKIDNSEVYSLDLKPRENRVHKFNFIIDAKDCNEDEILELLKNVKFSLIGYIYDIKSIKKGNLLDKEQHIVSNKTFKCQIIQN